MIKLGRYFTVEEFEFSQNAVRLGMDNTMPADAILRATMLVNNILDPLRAELRKPIVITSGYRTRQLNHVTSGSSPTSQHMLGEAADIIVPRMPSRAVFDRIVELGLPFDQLIEEGGKWVHVSYRYPPRGEKLRAVFIPNQPTNYYPI